MESAAISPESIALFAISVASTESVPRSELVSDSLRTFALSTAPEASSLPVSEPSAMSAPVSESMRTFVLFTESAASSLPPRDLVLLPLLGRLTLGPPDGELLD
jgi:hypothetical protein